jgi:hypothetical protein
VIGPELGPALIVTGLAAPLIGTLGLAIRRSTRRQECARLRDQLMDAARAGRLDLTDWRVVSLIDWFDHVATTGRTDAPGRHTGDRSGPADSLAVSLATTVLPLAVTGFDDAAWDAAWPEPPGPDPVLELQAAALAYRRRHQSHPRHLPEVGLLRAAGPRRILGTRQVRGSHRVSGSHPIPGPRRRAGGPAWSPPVGAVLLGERVPIPSGARVQPARRSVSLVEEIFAVAGSDR